jgi:hypothetical protein
VPRSRWSLVPFLQGELVSAWRVRHLAAFLGLSLMSVALAFWLPTFPEGIFRFFVRVLHLRDWPEIVMVNEFAGLIFFLYWIGVADALAIWVVPREEAYLELLLAKPLTRRAYMLVRLAPILLTLLILGAVASAVHWVSMRAAALDYDPRIFAGVAAASVAWAVCLVALANLLIIGAGDSYAALLIAFVPSLAAFIPGMVYVYRPDVYTPLVRDVLVFPANLVWYPDVGVRWGPPIALAMVAVALGLAALAGWRVERRDVT